MELKTQSGYYLLTKKEHEKIEQLKGLAKIIKNKYFSLGRDLDKFVKLINNSE